MEQEQPCRGFGSRMEPLAFTTPHALSWLQHRLLGEEHRARSSPPPRGRAHAACPDHPSLAPTAAVPAQNAALTAERETAQKCCAEEEERSRLLINGKCTVNGAFFPLPKQFIKMISLKFS